MPGIKSPMCRKTLLVLADTLGNTIVYDCEDPKKTREQVDRATATLEASRDFALQFVTSIKDAIKKVRDAMRAMERQEELDKRKLEGDLKRKADADSNKEEKRQEQNLQELSETNREKEGFA